MDASSGPVVLINLFEVPAEADAGFIAAWESARDFLAATATGRPPCTAASDPTPSSGSSTWRSGSRRHTSRLPPAGPTSPAVSCPFPLIPASMRSSARTSHRPRIPAGWC